MAAAAGFAQMAQADVHHYTGIGANVRGASAAWDRQKAYYKRHWKWERHALEKAGFNPILSLGGTPPGSAVQAARASAGPSAGPDASLLTGSAKEQANLLREQKANVKEDSRLKSAATNTELSRQSDLRSQIRLRERQMQSMGITDVLNEMSAKREAALYDSLQGTVEAAKRDKEMYSSPGGGLLRFLEKIAGSARDLSGAARDVDPRQYRRKQ